MAVTNVDAVDPRFRGHLCSGKWSLCVGAGLSRELVPTWQDLARQLVNETFSSSYSVDQFADLVAQSSWGLDSWIQACANHHVLGGGSPVSFSNLLEEKLYADLRERSRARRLERHLMAALNRPRAVSRETVARIVAFLEAEHAESSLLQVVRFLLRANDSGRMPEAIISFNADTLLHTVFELYQRHLHYQGPPPHSHPAYVLKTVLRPLDSAKEQTPLYHCHGAIMPRASAGRSPRDARDRLVFLESEYIRVATVSASWAETLFMFYAQTTRMIFVGVSMSDPNMRRWLALSNQSALQDVQALTSRSDMKPRHLWLTAEPSEPLLKNLFNESLIHLGIRPAWLKGWTEVGRGLGNLLAVSM